MNNFLGDVIFEGEEYKLQDIGEQVYRLLPHGKLTATLPKRVLHAGMDGLGDDVKIHLYKDAFSDESLKHQLLVALKYKDTVFWKYGLVRHGDLYVGGFYPLALIFSSEEIRDAVAEQNDRTSPPNRWVERKRKVITDKLGIDLADISIVGETPTEIS